VIQILATFEDGMFKPHDPLDLPPHTRVRLTIEPLESWQDRERRERAWQELERLWQALSLDSQGERLTRDQLHERS
jgi:hypothetical protein